MFKLFTDGGSRGNPGHAAIGFVIIDDDKIIDEFSEYIGIATNNIAEYKALAAGIERLIENGTKEVEIFMDSELVVKQIKGEYKVKNSELKLEYSKIKTLLSSFGSYKIKYVPREENKIADKLVNFALDTKLYK